MARFVLVHGGFSGAWIWLPLMDSLKAAGHLVEAFDLPGMGDDHTPASEVSLDSYAGRVCEALATSSEPAIVVGHSMGGIVATQAAARCPERVAALVYVAAFLPKDGQSLLDLTKLPECNGEQVLSNMVVEGKPSVAIMPPAASRLALYGSCAEEVAAWAITQQCPQPLSLLPMAVSIPPGALDGINRYYVLCVRDRAIPPPLQRRMVAENTCADVIELDADHTPQLSITNELANALDRFATHSSAGARGLSDRQDRADSEKTIMTAGSVSSRGRAQDARSRRPKVAIVTGASSGIGLEMVKRLIEKGYRVVANSRKITSAMTLHSTADLKLVDGDIGLEETAKRVVSAAIQNFETVDLLVNNAGIFIPKPFNDYAAEDFRRAMETNLSGFFYVSQLAVAQMRLQKSGHVVNISTSLVVQPIAGVAASLANLTKAGLESVTRALAIEFAAEGIRFNAIAPGVVNTPMNPAEAHEFLKQLSPLKRLAEVGEVADLLLYLESAQFINGEVVHLDGGAHAGKW